MLQRVERHIVVGNRDLGHLCHKSKSLYNATLYAINQHYLATQKYLSEYDLSTRFATENQYNYRNLPAQTSQQVIKLAFKNIKAYFRALEAYKLNPNKFTGCPQFPKYKAKTGQNVVVFTNQQCKLKAGYVHFPKSTNLKPLKTKVSNIQQVRIVPQATCHVIEVVYKKEQGQHDLDSNLYLSIDLGLNNLAALTSNTGTRPLLLNGRPLKSMNQYYHKKKAVLQAFVSDRTSVRMKRLIHKRNCKVADFLHKSSRFIVNYAREHAIGTIIIGYNVQWKTGINIGSKNNQNFCAVAHKTLINQITYKAEEAGIRVLQTEESYTSKCDALALEPVCRQETYAGKRKKRGLFESSVGRRLNADTNGSLNIARKVVGNDFVTASKGHALWPRKVHIS